MPRLRDDRLPSPAPDRPLVTVETFESFFRRELPRLTAVAYALTGSRAAAEDVAQDAMLAAYKRWDTIARLENPDAYVRRICANVAVSSMRRRWAEARALLRLGARSQTYVAMPEDSERFWAEVRRLPKRQAQVVALHYGCDLSVDEIAAALAVSNGSVKTHLHRARLGLAERFGDDAGTVADEGVPR